MARSRLSPYLDDDNEDSGVDRAITALSLAGSGEDDVHRFSDDDVDAFAQKRLGKPDMVFSLADTEAPTKRPDMSFTLDDTYDKPLRLGDLPNDAYDKPLRLSDLPDDGDGFSAMSRSMRAAGMSNNPVAHLVDPNDRLSPEDFELRARSTGSSGENAAQDSWDAMKASQRLQGQSNAPVSKLIDPENKMSPETFERAARTGDDADPRSPDKPKAGPVVEKTTIISSKPDEVGALSEAFDKTSGKKTPDSEASGGARRADFVGGEDSSKSEGSGFLGNISGWALVADALLNRGRGVGQIASMAQQQAAQERHDLANKKNSALQDEKTRAEIDHLRSMGKTASDWKADESARDWEDKRLREVQLGQGAQRVGLAVDRYGQQIDPNSALNTTKATVAGEVAGSAVRGREGAKHDLNDQIAGDAATIASRRTAASTDARQDVEAENAPRTAELAAVQSGMTSRAAAEAALPSQQTLKGTPSPSEQRTREQDAIAQAPLPGVEVFDDTAYKKANLTPEMSEKNRALLNTGNGAVEALDRAIETQKKYGGKLSTFETDPDVAKALRSSQDDIEHAIGAIGKANDLGVLNAGEYPRIAERALKPGEWNKTLISDAAVNALSGSHKDSVLESLEGMRQSLIDTQNSTLKLMGSRRAQPSVSDVSVGSPPPPESENNPGKLPVMKFDTKPDKVSAVIGQTPDSGVMSSEPPTPDELNSVDDTKLVDWTVTDRKGKKAVIRATARGIVEYQAANPWATVSD